MVSLTGIKGNKLTVHKAVAKTFYLASYLRSILLYFFLVLLYKFDSESTFQNYAILETETFAQSFLLFVTPWTVAHQSPLFMGFSRQEYWSG